MSKTLNKSLGTDLAALAQVLRSKGRGRDTVLAHITPKEAALLKRRGGSGTINPDTGLPEFEDEGYFGDPSEGFQSSADLPSYETSPEIDYSQFQTPDYGSSNPAYFGDPSEGFQSSADLPALQTSPEMDYSQFQTPAATPAAAAAAAGGGAGGKDKPTFMSRVGDYLSDPANLAKLGLLGAGALFGAKQGQTASQQGQAAAGQIREMVPPIVARSEVAQKQYGDIAQGIRGSTALNAAELASLGAPQRELGLRLMSQAESGNLSPANMKALNALKAVARQNASKRGGVGAMQAGVAEQEATANLLQQQLQQGVGTYQQGAGYSASAIQLRQQAEQAANGMQVAAINTGLQQAGIADQYTMNAIMTGLQMDQATATSLKNFYTSLAQVGFGQISSGLKNKFDPQTGLPIA
jgi:hypothetical protein